MCGTELLLETSATEHTTDGEDRQIKISAISCTRHCAGSLYRAPGGEVSGVSGQARAQRKEWLVLMWQGGAKKNSIEEVCVWGGRVCGWKDKENREHGQEGILDMSKGSQIRCSLDFSGNVRSSCK